MRRGGWLALALIAAGAPALAAAHHAAKGGWGLAHWGMSRAAVRAAYKSKLVPPDPGEEDVSEEDLKAHQPFGPFSVAVKFEFDDSSHLSQVTLAPVFDHSRCAAIAAYLTTTYGPMRHDSGGGDGYRTRTWSDPKDGNQINWITEGPGYAECHIELVPPGSAAH